MKKFNFSKGLVIGLLTLALVLTGFATVKASAAAGDTHKITFVASEDSNVTYEVTYKEGATGDDAVDPIPANIDMEDIIAGLNKPNGVIYTKKTGNMTATPADEDIALSDSGVVIKAIAKKDYTITVPVKALEVTFNVTVVDLSGAAAKETVYTFKADTDFQRKGKSIALATVLEGMKNGETPLEDPTAWVFLSYTTNNDKFTYASEKFTLADDLAADLTIYFKVVNSKITKQFTYDGYTAEFEIDNKKGDTTILYADIIDKLSKTVGEGNAAVTTTYVEDHGESVILADGFGGTNTGKYATWAYKLSLAEVSGVKLAPAPIAPNKVVPAFSEAGYDPATDSIVFESPVELTVYWADVKKAAGAQLKGSALKTLDLKANKEKTAYVGSIALNDKSAGVKIGENKTAYIYASFRAPADEKAKVKYTPNFVVDATPYKKIAVTFAYALADKEYDEAAIASITTIDNNKKTVIYSGAVTAEHENGLAAIIGELQYSTDGTTWYGIVGNDPVVVSGKEVSVDLDCIKLYEYVNSGSKTTLYFRIAGGAAIEAKEASGTEGQEGYKPAVEAKNAYRATKVVKATIAAAKEAKAVKINVATGTIALKNGYDYATTDPAEKGKNEPSISDAHTILPFNKLGKAKDANEKDIYTIATSDYVPVKKVTDNDKMFTNIKVKSVLIEDIADTSADMYIWIRKSASVSKPAEKWVCITLGKVTDAPVITKTKAGYFSAQDPADTKGVIATPEIKNASSDKNSGAYEYLIIDAADYAEGAFSVDFTSAKWTTLNDKGLTVGKSKSKYATAVGAKAKTAVLKEGSIVLVRRAGDKSSNILASNFEMTMVVKQDLEVEVEKADGTKEKTTKSLYVWTEYKAQ